MIRFGIIGTNWITEEWIKAARELESFQLTAVYSRTEQKAREFADKHGVELIYTDLQQLANSTEVDAIYIASPNSLHMEHAIQCMNQGKHVMCEKPMASNARELQKMIDAARANQVVLMEAMKSTLMPSFSAIQEHLHKIGPVRRYFASFCQYSSRYDAYKQGNILNAFKPVFSNGSLMDLGVYGVYPLVVLFGKPETVQASAVMLDSGVDGQGSLILKYAQMEAVIMHSKITSSSLPAEILGEDGSIIIPKISQPKDVVLRYKDGTVERVSPEEKGHSMMYEVKEFIHLIETGQLESTVNSHHHSLLTIEIIDEARRQIGLVYPSDRQEEI
jgi:predicted dehydrogenase